MRNTDNKTGLRLCLRTTQVGRTNKKSVYLYSYRRRICLILPFLERILRTGRYTTLFQERIDKTLEFKHPASLDDIIIVNKGSAEKHKTEVKETMKKLEEAAID